MMLFQWKKISFIPAVSGNLLLIFRDISLISDEILFAVDLPTLENMIIQEHDDSFSESRWSLFQWLLGLDADTESISNIKRSFNDKYIRIVLFTLDFLLKVKTNQYDFQSAIVISVSFLSRQTAQSHCVT